MSSTIPSSPHRRTALIVTAVLLLHALALWALNCGLLRRVVEVVVPVEVLSEVVEPPRPVVPPPPPPPQVRPPPRQAVVQPDTPPPPRPAVTPPPVLAMPVNPEPSPQAPTAIAAPPALLPPMTAPVTPTAVAGAPAKQAPVEIRPTAPPKVELPSSEAQLLSSPSTVYPKRSRMNNEEGEVLVRVLIGVDGKAQKAEIEKSSNFDLLDQASISAALAARYVPAKHAGVPAATWLTVKFSWVLNK